MQRATPWAWLFHSCRTARPSDRLDDVLERLARAKCRTDGGADSNLSARARVATRARLALARLEGAETADLHALAPAQRVGDEAALRIEQRLDGACGLRLRHAGLVRKCLNQIRLVHLGS